MAEEMICEWGVRSAVGKWSWTAYAQNRDRFDSWSSSFHRCSMQMAAGRFDRHNKSTISPNTRTLR